MKKAIKLLAITSLTFGGALTLTSCGTKVTTFEEFRAAMEDKPIFGNPKIVLENDIDCGGVDWTPIEFDGEIDGNGHKLSNLNISASGDNVGLVSTGRAVFTNITIENFTVNVFSTGKNLGLLVGDGGGFSNVKISGTINAPAYDNVGALAGSSLGGGTDCEINVNINAHAYIGGAFGKVTGTKVEKVTNNGVIKGTGDYVAGVVGYCEREYVDGVIESYYKPVTKINDCVNNGQVISTGSYTGGISGYYAREFNNCINNKGLTHYLTLQNTQAILVKIMKSFPKPLIQKQFFLCSLCLLRTYT